MFVVNLGQAASGKYKSQRSFKFQECVKEALIVIHKAKKDLCFLSPHLSLLKDCMEAFYLQNHILFCPLKIFQVVERKCTTNKEVVAKFNRFNRLFYVVQSQIKSDLECIAVNPYSSKSF